MGQQPKTKADIKDPTVKIKVLVIENLQKL